MKKASLAVHAGTRPDTISGGINTPIVTSSAFDYLDQPEVRYPRYFNLSNQQAVVDKLCALEAAEDGLLFASGMAAITAIFSTELNSGDHAVLLAGLYGGTHEWAIHEFAKRGIEVDFVAPDSQAIEQACRDNTRLIYIESPTNPLLRVVDIKAVADIARARDIRTAIDNTFASPVLQNPLRHGFDYVMHSATKYLGGHSDLCCGIVVASKERIADLRPTAVRYGGSVNAQTAALLERSLKTLALRVERASRNALAIATALADSDGITRVYYPGLETDPQHTVAAGQMSAFGGMLAFELASSIDPVDYQRRLKLIVPAVSLGGVESTICQPVATSHQKMPAADRHKLGIGDSLLRLSTGIEDVGDLIADLRQALQV